MADFTAKYGIKPLRCPACGLRHYRERRFAPALHPCYGGEEIIAPEICGEIQPSDYGCEPCAGLLEIVPGGMMDLLPADFEIDMEMFGDGSDKRKRRVHSLKELRTIENESLRRAANGEGKPLIWRDLSQDRSNKDVHTLRGTVHETGRAKPLPRRQTQSGLPITGSALESQPD